MNNILVIHDFETGSKNPYTTQPLQWAALAIDGRSFKVLDFFETKMRPFPDEECEIYGLAPVEDEALLINGIRRDEMEKFPSLKESFNSIEHWIKHLNPKGAGTWNGPVRIGFNNLNFDEIIMERLIVGHWAISNRITGIPEGKKEPYKFSKSKVDKFGDVEQNLFNYKKLDIAQLMIFWIESIRRDSLSYSMDAYRDFLGLDSKGSHDAAVDVYDEAAIMTRFLSFMREHAKKSIFENCFNGLSGKSWITKEKKID